MSRAHSFVIILVFVGLALAAAACSDSSPAAASPTPSTTSDTFTSSLTQLGSTGYPFTVTSTGTITVTLTNVAPLSNMSLGVSIGSWTGSSCATAFSSNDNARAGTPALAGQIVPGNYCVNVYDSGNLTADAIVDFSAMIVHP